MKEMVGGCCVCSDERGWPENPLVYCDGQNCTVAVHQACYGIVTVPTGPWYCRKCESQERSARVRCELCPSRDGALKKTDNQGWAHVVCALYIPEVRFGNVSTMEPIILQLIPPERYNKSCYICADVGKGSKATAGACMQCNKSGCKQQFHVTCAQQLGLLCEEAGNYLDNVKYCGYCQHHYSKLKKGGNVKPIPPYKPITHETNSSDSPSSPEKDAELLHQASRSSSNRPVDPLATASLSTSSSSSKQKKSSSSSTTKSSSGSSNTQIPYSSSSNAPSNVAPVSGSGSRTSSSSSSKDKEKESKHSSSSSKSVNKISSSTNNKHDKDPSSYSSYSTSSSSRDKNKSSSSSSKSSSQNVSNKDEGVSSNSHNSKGSSQFSSSSTIRITTSSATPTSPVSTIIHKHEANSSSSSNSNVVQASNNSIMTSQVQNPKSNNDDEGKSSSWHHQNNMGSSKMSNYPSGGGSGMNSDGLNDSSNDANKANFNAMTKKRKAMHQANSSNRNSADENTSNSIHRDVCKDLSVKVVPLDKLDPSVSEFERHYKKARTDISSQSTPAAAVAPPQEPNIQNVNPNVIHSTGSTTVTSVSSHNTSASPASSPLSGTNNKSQVITQNIHAKLSGSSKDDRQQHQQQQQQPESLVVSVPLSSATVPGIQLPTTNSSNSSSNNNSTVSTIVTNQVQQHQQAPPTASPNMSSPSVPPQGSLYQHLTNNQAANQRASPLIQQGGLGRASPITPTPIPLVNDSHGANNHTSVLQNMNAGSGGVISSAGFHGISTSTTETSPAGGLKVTYEKQVTSARIQAIQHEETSRRSRTPDSMPFSSVPTAGGLKFAFEQQQPTQPPAGLVINTNTHHALKESPPSSPGSEASARKRRKPTPQQSPLDYKEKETKIVIQNGAVPATHHMLGNQLNPNSSMAKNMAETLNMEIEAHSIYSHEPAANLVGPQYPGRKDLSKQSSSTSSTTTSSGPASLTSMLSGASSSNGTPQSLEQLLERQWEQGSQFLMEQAQHFDIASLLSCLHQLKIENSRLEDHINGLVSRRDHLLAVNARLAIPLGQQTSTSQATHLNNGPSEPTSAPQQQPQPQPQAPPVSITNKRPAPSNPVSTIQVPPIENGLDYRGHHGMNSNQQTPSSQATSQSSNIRHSPAVLKSAASAHVVTIDGSNINQHPPHQFQTNAQFQQMYQQATHVNSVRGRQGNNSFQSQQAPSGGSGGYSTVHKTKN